MKNYLFALGLLLFTIGGTAQTKNHRICLTAGFGSQQYNGNLGNNFYNYSGYNYGVASVNLSYYLDKYFDVTLGGTTGDYGLCQTGDVANKEISTKYRCPGCNRKGFGNLSSRMTSGVVSFKYKIANGDILMEDAKIAPYIYLGIGINHIVDRMKMNCVCPGDYFSLNTGAGFKYNLSEKLNIGYNVALGFFQADKIDFIDNGGHDKYLQNTIFIGVAL